MNNYSIFCAFGLHKRLYNVIYYILQLYNILTKFSFQHSFPFSFRLTFNLNCFVHKGLPQLFTQPYTKRKSFFDYVKRFIKYKINLQANTSIETVNFYI